jgi:hypothetical protein
VSPLRWIAVAGSAVVALVVLAAVVAYATIDTEAIRRYAEAEIGRLTGRQVTARSLALDLWPRLAVVARDVTISNPAGASRPDLARARSVKGAVAIFPLLRSRSIVVEELEIEGLDASLETLADGRGNWALAGAAPGPAAPATAGAKREGAPFRLAGTFGVVDAKVSWRPPGGAVQTLAIPRLDVSPETEGRYAWKGSVDLDGVRWSIEATTGDPVLFARDRVPLEVDSRIAGGGVTLNAKGRVERRDTGPGFVADASLAWTAGSEWLSRRAPRLARDEGRVSARLEVRERRLTIDGLAGAVAGSRFDGSLDVDLKGKVPRIDGRLHADVVDLSRERQAPAAPAPAPAAEGDVPVSRLASLDADVDFVIDRLELANAFEATSLRGRILVSNGRLDADPIDLDFGGGKITGHVHADAATGRARVVVDGRGIQLARAAPRLEAGKYLSGGATSIAIDLQGPARSAAGFIAGASGSIRAETGPMQVRGIALDAGGDAMTRIFDAVNPFRRVDPSTDIQCAVVRLAVADGIAHADRTIAVETSRLTASASGTIDLAHETLDLLVRPRARKVASLPPIELAEVIRVTGPIRKPSFRLDTLGAAKTAATIGGAVATGGWSLLATPLLGAGDDKSPCATARAGGKAAGGTQASPAAPTPADPLAPLRGLFGR